MFSIFTRRPKPATILLSEHERIVGEIKRAGLTARQSLYVLGQAKDDEIGGLRAQLDAAKAENTRLVNEVEGLRHDVQMAERAYEQADADRRSLRACRDRQLANLRLGSPASAAKRRDDAQKRRAG